MIEAGYSLQKEIVAGFGAVSQTCRSQATISRGKK
jgi:hypothetical protein